MGTKRNPGDYDCYANAHPDEPMFILIGRDERAPTLVDAWAKMSEERGTDPTKIADARRCAEDMRRWREEVERNGVPTAAPSHRMSSGSLSRLRLLRAEGSKGRWFDNAGDVFVVDDAEEGEGILIVNARDSKDSALIAAAVNNLVPLLNRVGALEAENAKLRAQLGKG